MRALPALTVELAQAEARSATRRVLLALLLAYVLSFQAGLWFMHSASKTKVSEPMPSTVPLAVLALSVVLGLVHYRGARRVGLDRVLERLGVPLEEQGLPAEALRRFRNVVEEASLAAGLKGVQTLVLDSPQPNAFAAQDHAGAAAIGVSRGLLTSFSRPALEAVAAQQAARLLFGDGRLALTLAALSDVFARFLGSGSARRGQAAGPGRTGTSLPFAGVLVAGFAGRVLLRWLSALLSRERALEADAAAVGLCKNPRGLAEALETASQAEPADPAPPEAYAPLFFVSPRRPAHPGLFSTHPPLERRLAQVRALERGGTLEAEVEATAQQKLNALVTRGPLHFLKARAREGSALWRGIFVAACLPLAAGAALLWGLQWHPDFHATADSLVELETALDSVQAPGPGRPFTLRLHRIKARFEPTRTPDPCGWCDEFIKNTVRGDGLTLWVRGEALARERAHGDEGSLRFYALADLERPYFDVRAEMTPAHVRRRRWMLAAAATPFTLGLIFFAGLLCMRRRP